MTKICQLQQGLALIILTFCAVKACNINIYSNSSIGFTIQPCVNESDIDFDSNSVQWIISPCNHNSASKLIITCAKNFTLQDIAEHKIDYSGNGSFCERNTIGLKLNIVGCQSVRAKSMKTITVENCTFTSSYTAGCQTMLNFSNTNATVKKLFFYIHEQ